MKKMFLLAAMAGVALASCTNEESAAIDSAVQQSRTIGWDTHVISTRADYNNDSFASAAYKTGTDTEEIPLQEIANQASGWTTATPYYWKSYAFDFVSVSPYSAVSSFTVTNNSISINYDITDQDKVADLMYADKVVGINANKVPVAFHHALAKLNVNIQTGALTDAENAPYNEWVVNVKSLKIEGYKTSGKVTLNVGTTSGTSASYNATDNVWTVIGDAATETLIPESNSTESNSTESKTITTSSTPLLKDHWVIPQALTENAKITIEYDVTMNTYLVEVAKKTTSDNVATFETRSYKKEIALNTQSLSTVTGKWEMNKNVTYNIVINPIEVPTRIIWDTPTVTDFVDDSATITINVKDEKAN